MPAAIPLCTFGRHLKSWSSSADAKGTIVVKLRLRDGEKIQDAVKRFRKLVEHAGIKKEMRRREFYEKPSDTARRSRRRAERRARLNRLQ
jgi:small subunit ribosomal protein S21